MGTLNEVYQLKPLPVYGAAFLRVKTKHEKPFSEKYLSEKPKTYAGHLAIMENVVGEISSDGKVLKFGQYQEDRIIDLQKPGIYLHIQSMNKHGFGDDFEELIREYAPYLEDQLFFVVWDDYIQHFDIQSGKLNYKYSRDMSEYDFKFENYILAHYPAEPQFYIGYMTDFLADLKVEADYMLQTGGDLDDYYEPEEYQEYLEKMQRFPEMEQTEEEVELIDWLKEKIANYKPFKNESNGQE